AAELDELRLVGAEAGAQDEPGRYPRAERRVGLAGDAGVGHGRVLAQRGFDLGRVDVLAARDDEVAAPVEHGQVAAGLEPADVAGVEPAVAERGGGRFGPAQVAGHERRAAHRDLAFDAARQLYTVR